MIIDAAFRAPPEGNVNNLRHKSKNKPFFFPWCCNRAVGADTDRPPPHGQIPWFLFMFIIFNRR